ncbi:MAG TPA: hypothetical protein VG538_05930 [Vicinamibacterales bacterium]|jgi:hypothetical protein|nr:hypothetical protein [Vicinamibacterales bacterium]
MHAQDSTSVRRQVLIPGSRERARAQRMLDALLAEAEAEVRDQSYDGRMDLDGVLALMFEIVSRRGVGVVCAALEAAPERRFLQLDIWPATVGA